MSDTKSPAKAFGEIAHKEAKAGSFVVCSVGKKVVIDSQGVGLSELKKAFASDKVLFAAFNVHGVDERANVKSTRTKIIQINWIGSDVAPMKKMGALSGKSKITKVFKGMAATMNINEVDDLTVESIAKILLASGGAHKPSYYLFGPDESEKYDLNFYSKDNK
uniref:ADF-H domain-containing protein n=1 Tax=Lotharella oceanica TaxID=641309 RepID=A0A7S2XC18_9EUKA